MTNPALRSQIITASIKSEINKSKKQDAIIKKLLADDGDEHSDRGKLKVLNDGDGVRLLMNIYQDYVSDDDYVAYPDFMYKVDTLLYKARGNRPLTREERDELAEAPTAKKVRKKKKSKPPTENSDSSNTPNSVDTTVTASTDKSNYISKHMSKFIKDKRAA